MILNQSQAEAVYSAMCALNNIAARAQRLYLPNDVEVVENIAGAVQIQNIPDGTGEYFSSQAAFAAAYNLT